MAKPDTIRVLQWPIVEPVTLTEAKAQVALAQDQTEHDRFLLDKIAAARRLIERRLSVTLVATQYRATWQTGGDVLDLPAPPVLISGTYPITVTVDGTALASTDYEVDQDAFPATLTLDTATTSKVVVVYWGGVAPGGVIEPTIRSALLAYVNHSFENRGVLNTEGGGELPQAFETLLAASSWNGGW
jgi:uncharacterized phiE125 gp8 family phage protein